MMSLFAVLVAIGSFSNAFGQEPPPQPVAVASIDHIDWQYLPNQVHVADMVCAYLSFETTIENKPAASMQYSIKCRIDSGTQFSTKDVTVTVPGKETVKGKYNDFCHLCVQAGTEDVVFQATISITKVQGSLVVAEEKPTLVVPISPGPIDCNAVPETEGLSLKPSLTLPEKIEAGVSIVIWFNDTIYIGNPTDYWLVLHYKFSIMDSQGWWRYIWVYIRLPPHCGRCIQIWWHTHGYFHKGKIGFYVWSTAGNPHTFESELVSIDPQYKRAK